MAQENDKKDLMLRALRETLGNVSEACKASGVPRRTHYNWIDSDESYAHSVGEISEVTLDFAENALLSQIRENNTVATIFFLKTKGKSRGYVEKLQVDIQRITIVDDF